MRWQKIGTGWKVKLVVQPDFDRHFMFCFNYICRDFSCLFLELRNSSNLFSFHFVGEQHHSFYWTSVGWLISTFTFLSILLLILGSLGFCLERWRTEPPEFHFKVGLELFPKWLFSNEVKNYCELVYFRN